MKKLTIGVVATLLSISVVQAQDKKAQTKPAAPAVAAQTGDPVVIKFGNTEVKKSEFEAAISTLPAEYQEMASGPAKRSFAEEYVRMKMLALEAERQGLEKDAKVQAQLRLMRDNTLANAALEKLQASVTVPDAEMQKAYDAQKSTFEKAKARHILIAFKGSPAAQAGKKEITEEEARKKAEEIRAKLVGGADFAATAKAESDDVASGARGGELGEFGRGDMVPEFEKAAFEGKVGEISPVIKTQFGYHIIKVDERKAPALADVRSQLEGGLKQKALQDKLDAMKKSQNITFSDSYFPAAPAVSSLSGPEADPDGAAAAEAKPKKKEAPKKKP